MPTFTKNGATASRVQVHVDPHELDCGFKTYPFGTCLGVLDLDTLEITRWTPVGYRPRGFGKARDRLLRDILEHHKKGIIDLATLAVDRKTP